MPCFLRDDSAQEKIEGDASEKRLKDEFLDNNPQLIDSIVEEEKALYFKDELSFSRRDNLVTHGGAHFLEVVIPFIEIINE